MDRCEIQREYWKTDNQEGQVTALGGLSQGCKREAEKLDKETKETF